MQPNLYCVSVCCGEQPTSLLLSGGKKLERCKNCDSILTIGTNPRNCPLCGFPLEDDE